MTVRTCFFCVICVQRAFLGINDLIFSEVCCT